MDEDLPMDGDLRTDDELSAEDDGEMDEKIRVEEMHADEIAELLEVNEEQAAAIREFIQSVGGIENAEEALALLSRLPHAA
jgi:hypothetical protein